MKLFVFVVEMSGVVAMMRTFYLFLPIQNPYSACVAAWCLFVLFGVVYIAIEREESCS